jgi:hypothetical protein
MSTPRKRKPQGGVRGPRGPQQTPPAKGGGRTPAKPGSGRAPAPGRRARFEELSLPIIRTLAGLPRWLVVVTPAVLLVLGLVLSGPLAWLGAIFLIVILVFITWLTALSWPAITPGSRILRSIVVLALAGVTVLKLFGDF